MRPRTPLLLVAALAAASGCRSWAPVLVRVELPSPTLFPANTIAAILVADFRDEAAAARSPLAQRLFQVEGVEGVFLGSDFISVTKPEDKE
ncbi:MAG TPA: hypothetical protein ENO03_03265, partial [Candidatus Aminicenantes bacterium]|nr:hypothetical protein [Candidatus Aminicenantes bacterium]